MATPVGNRGNSRSSEAIDVGVIHLVFVGRRNREKETRRDLVSRCGHVVVGHVLGGTMASTGRLIDGNIRLTTTSGRSPAVSLRGLYADNIQFNMYSNYIIVVFILFVCRY